MIKNGYSRNIISKKNGFWMSLIKWDADIKTPLHGHPDFTFVYIIKGEIINIPYNSSLKSEKKVIYPAGKYFYDIGEKDKFDNAPHKILTKIPSISLHFYSDDGRKGKVFNF